jgi:hypothetical protein
VNVSLSFLALVLKKEREERIADLGRKGSWPEILADLNSPNRDQGRAGRQMLLAALATASRRHSLARSAAGVALPPTVRQVNAPPAAASTARA